MDEKERQVLTSLLEINCQELRSFLKQQGTLNLPSAVKEHKKLELHPFSPMPFMRRPTSQYSVTLPRSSQSTDEEE